MVRKQQLFSVLGEIVPYKKFKKRGGEPFFTCISGGARRFLTIIFNVLPRTCPVTIAPSLNSINMLLFERCEIVLVYQN